MSGINPVMARKLGRSTAEAEGAPASETGQCARVLRGALMRAADRAIGLTVSVLGLGDETTDAEALVEQGPEGWMVLGLCDEGTPGLAGLVLIDAALRSAMIEVQTMGMLMEAGGEERPVTATDAALTLPVIEAFLTDLAGSGQAEFPAWVGGLRVLRLPDLRAAGLKMRDCRYRLWQASLQIGGTDRQGTLHFALAGRPETAKAPGTAPDTWQQDLQGALGGAEAQLDAVLCRMPMSYAQIEGFEVGQVLHLSGVTVGSVQLEGPGAAFMAPARLGQVSGQRAVRLETPDTRMEEIERAAPAPAPAPQAASAPPRQEATNTDAPTQAQLAAS